MTSPLDNLCGPGKDLEREAPDKQEYAGLIDDGLRKLNDARNPDLFLGSRFDLAYNAAFSLSLAALRRLGYRPVNKRFFVFQVLPHTLNLGPEVWRVLDNCHNLRNKNVYHGVVNIDERLVEDLIEAGRRTVAGQTAAALKFGDPRVMALCQALVLFSLLPQGFRHAGLRAHVAQLPGKTPAQYRSGQVTYDLRRLRLHGLIERIPSSRRYRVTSAGLRIGLFFTKVHSRLLRGGLSQLFDPTDLSPSRPLAAAVNRVENMIEKHIQCAKIAA